MPRPRPPMELLYPVAGVDESAGFQAQPPYTTPDALNTRPRVGRDRRLRGGSRPGLVNFEILPTTPLAGSVCHLGSVEQAQADKFDFLADTFAGLAMSSAWSTPSWIAGGKPTIDDSLAYATNAGGARGGVFNALTDFDTAEIYHIGLLLVPYAGVFAASFQIFLRMNDATPILTTDGVQVSVTLSSGGAYTGTVTTYASTVATPTSITGGTLSNDSPRWLIARIDDDELKVYLGGTLIHTQSSLPTAAGKRVGFGISGVGSTSRGQVDRFRAQWYRSGDYTILRPRLLAVANGGVYRETYFGQWAAVSGSSLPAGVPIFGCELGGKYYFSNPAASGTVHVYTPGTDSLATSITSTTDPATAPPAGSSLICRYRYRLVVSGAASDPNQVFFSRTADPGDWDYGQDPGDESRAVALVTKAGQPVRALMPFIDDYLLIGCRSSIWIMRGDPAGGGVLDNVSETVGVLGGASWCRTDDGAILFMGRGGLYAIGGQGGAQNVSRRVPAELVNLDPANFFVQLAFDQQRRGVHIFVTPTSATSGTRHWWMDWETKGIVPESYADEPLFAFPYAAADAEDSCVLLGTRGGYIVRHYDRAEKDVGTAFTSYTLIGPFALGDGFHEGYLDEMMAMLAEDSGDVDWSLHVGDTAEAAVLAAKNADVFDSGAWTAGRNDWVDPRASGMAAVVKVAGKDGRAWAMEKIMATRKSAGKVRS